MKITVALGIFIAISPLGANAICVVEPLEPELRAADVVYVGTVIRSEVTGELPSLELSRDHRNRRIELRHTLQPQITFKGNPAEAPAMISTWQYNPPQSKTTVDYAERVVVMPGDTYLVVARGGESVRVNLCSPTRKWDAATAKVVRAEFSPAP